MNTTMRMILLGLTLALPACSEEPPPRSVFDTMRIIHTTNSMTGGKEETQPPCKDCAWSTFVVDTAPVSELECIKDASQHPHCHMRVKNFKPKSDILVTRVGDKYHLELRTQDDKNTGIDCPALNQHPDFPDVIWGDCVLRHPGLEGDPEHKLAAILEFMESTGKHRIRFVYAHSWQTKDGAPIHNGEGHAHVGGG